MIEVVCHIFSFFLCEARRKIIAQSWTDVARGERRRVVGGCGEEKPSDFGSGREGGADELQACVIAKRATVGRKGQDLRVFF